MGTWLAPWRAMLRSLWSLDKFFRVGAGLATCYFLLDATEEVSLWLTCREKVKTATNSNLDLIREIGEPILPGRYWDSSLRTTHRGNLLHCTIPVRGDKGASDVQIKLVKSKGTGSLLGDTGYWVLPGENLLYNVIGPGEWKVLVHYAVIGAAGGLPKHFNLEEGPVREDGLGEGSSSGE